MSYIITARVDTLSEDNLHADKNKVNASILSEKHGEITFDIPGDFKNSKELTKGLCNSLIDAGYLSFKIGHSY